MRALPALLVLVVAALLAPLAAAVTGIDNVRVYRAPEYTRFVFDVSEPPQYQVLPDAAPGRVVIDFRNAELKAKLDTVDLQDSPVRRVRSGQQPENTLRIVFDLAVAVRTNSFTLPPNAQYGHRLVVDLYDQVAEEKPKPVAPVPVAPPPPGTPSPARRIIVAIDAGHGGEDPGARGANGAREKDIVLAIARAVRDRMLQEPGMKPVLIRDGDYYVGLKERRTIARRKHNADIFVSIHADAFTKRAARGASVFAVSRRGATSNTAAYLAEAENRADQVGGIDPKSDNDVLSVISDLIMEGTMSHSLHVGRSVLDELGGFARLHKGGVEQAGFMVLKEPNMPSILVETGFISNPDEERLLTTVAYQQRLAGAIVNGVRRYFERYPPPGTVYAANRDGRAPDAARPAAVQLAAAGTVASDADREQEDGDSAAVEALPDDLSTTGRDPLMVLANGGSSAPATAHRKPAKAKPVPAREKFVEHKVRRGQSLGWLAKKYGVSQRAIKEANKLKRDELRIGETLKIPQP